MTTIKLKHGDCLATLRSAPDNYADSLVTDPPAGISFMGKDWDGDKGGRDAWIAWMTEVMGECLRVLKPGAHGLVWAIPRTAHWTMTAPENAGFEVRDVVTHLFGTGFPKSLDVSKAIDKAAGAEREVTGPKSTYRKPQQPNGWDCSTRAEFETAPATSDAKRWQGWGTALKPACEFWVLVRKPLAERTVAQNVLKHGTGALNIDGCRIGISPDDPNHRPGITHNRNDPTSMFGIDRQRRGNLGTGRFPSHLVLDEEAAAALDEQSGTLTSGSRKAGVRKGMGFHGADGDGGPAIVASDGGASRFFYVAKASKSDKGEGNVHPTVKSTALMAYLIKLVTPPGGIVLDPFMGSGSTGVAAKREGFGFVGIEQEQEYFDIANSRLEGAA